jgi:Response regulator receiver domain
MGRTVLIVDDHAAFRAAARALLEAGDFEVVGEAEDGAAAIAAAAELRPEIVLLDIHLPDLDGFAVAERLATDGVSHCLSRGHHGEHPSPFEPSRSLSRHGRRRLLQSGSLLEDGACRLARASAPGDPWPRSKARVESRGNPALVTT